MLATSMLVTGCENLTPLENAGVFGAAPPSEAPGSEWARLHPLTPVLRGWKALGVVAWFMQWVRKRGFTPFAVYRIVLGLVGTAVQMGITGRKRK